MASGFLRGARRTLRVACIGLEVVGRKSAEFGFGSAVFREFLRMAKRTDGKTKLTSEVRQRLVEAAKLAGEWVYGEARCPEWRTSFAEIESDAKEVGYEFIRLLMEQVSQRQTEHLPDSVLTLPSGETAVQIGTADRTLETESGAVQWKEPKTYLPKSRKAFVPSVPSVGLER